MPFQAMRALRDILYHAPRRGGYPYQENIQTISLDIFLGGPDQGKLELFV